MLFSLMANQSKILISTWSPQWLYAIILDQKRSNAWKVTRDGKHGSQSMTAKKMSGRCFVNLAEHHLHGWLSNTLKLLPNVVKSPYIQYFPLSHYIISQYPIIIPLLSHDYPIIIPLYSNPTQLSNLICSMSGIFTYIYPTNGPNVGKYAIHGAYGNNWF